jgi:uncharacterized RDD family membrane protein YckC
MENNQSQYAGFWRRAAAYIMDAFIVGYIGMAYYWPIYTRLQALDRHGWMGPEVYAAIIQYIFGFAITWAYFCGMESSPLRATVGKLAVGLFVTDKIGGRITFGQASGRFFGKYLSTAILCIGFLMAGWTEQKQGLHDMMAGTLVYRK